MNKTIHELNSLTQAQADDELIIYDVSEGESKKIQVQDLNNPNYSTTEQKTGGTWIDGKPIYRNVLQGTLTSVDMSVNHNISNLGTVIRQYGFLRGENFTPAGFYFGNYYFSTYTDSSKVNIRASSNYVNETFVIILEYTKN